MKLPKDTNNGTDSEPSNLTAEYSEWTTKYMDSKTQTLLSLSLSASQTPWAARGPGLPPCSPSPPAFSSPRTGYMYRQQRTGFPSWLLQLLVLESYSLSDLVPFCSLVCKMLGFIQLPWNEGLEGESVDGVCCNFRGWCHYASSLKNCARASC